VWDNGVCAVLNGVEYRESGKKKDWKLISELADGGFGELKHMFCSGRYTRQYVVFFVNETVYDAV
jgi:hypothetical protein